MSVVVCVGAAIEVQTKSESWTLKVFIERGLTGGQTKAGSGCLLETSCAWFRDNLCLVWF